MAKNKIHSLYLESLKIYENPEELWPDWCSKNKSKKTREIIAIGAVLTQRTSWRNAEVALKNLAKEGLLSLEAVSKPSNLEQLAKLIRPAGFYTTKPKRLQSLSSYILDKGGVESLMNEKTNSLRQELLKVYGVGPETADTLLLYAFDKPSFVIDEYTKRFLKKHGMKIDGLNYITLREMFEDSLPRDVVIYQNYHVLMIVDQKGKEWSEMGKITLS